MPRRVGTHGYPDWPNQVPANGNVAGAGTDFSQFWHFQRGVVIIEVEYAGLVKKQTRLGNQIGIIGIGEAPPSE